MQQQSLRNGKGPLVPYIRQSRAKERSISLKDQRKAIEGWAKTNGVKLAEPIEEKGVSGSKSWRERELGKAIAACERGDAAGVIVAFQDRLSRENGVATAEVYETLQRANARLVCAAEGLDTAAGDQELIFTIKAGIAREQWKRHRLNWANGVSNAIDRGVHTSTPPAGYTPSVVLDEDGNPKRDRDGKIEHGPLAKNDHAPAVLAAFEARAKGASWSQVARLLTTLGVPTGKDRRRNDGTLTPWLPKSAAGVLHNEVYLGHIRSGEFVNDDAHDPIVTKALWSRVRARDAEPGSWSATRREPALLVGVLRCASCGGAMTRDSNTRPDGRKNRYYRCKKIGVCPARVTIGLDRIERYLSEFWIEQTQVRLHHPPKHGKNRDAKRATLEAAVTAAEEELETYVTATSASDIGAELFAKGLGQRKRAVDEAVTALQAIEDDVDADALAGLPSELLKGRRREGFARALWESMDNASKNRSLKRLFPEGIDVSPGRGSVKDRIGPPEPIDYDD